MREELKVERNLFITAVWHTLARQVLLRHHQREARRLSERLLEVGSAVGIKVDAAVEPDGRIAPVPAGRTQEALPRGVASSHQDEVHGSPAQNVRWQPIRLSSPDDSALVGLPLGP
eukprot:3645692-Prymnesium_polylepis.4